MDLENKQKRFEAKFPKLEEIQDKNQERILSLSNVVGAGVGFKYEKGEETDDPCIMVFVDQKLPKKLLKKGDLIPSQIDETPTDVIETGEIFAGEMVAPAVSVRPTVEPRVEEEPAVEALRNRVRPVEGGYSVGHYRITAGTYATAVVDRGIGIPRTYYALSNNHVLANSNDARVGDPILQPGRADGGIEGRDTIARLSRWVNIRFTEPGRPVPLNLVDAATAEGPFQVLDREIYWIGYVQRAAQARIGMDVQKTGRTTNWTTGRVTAMNATVNVNYGNGRIARFVRQIVTTNMSAPGDSGSLLLDTNRQAVGLLFAGSSRVTIHNDIRFVQYLLGIQIV